MKISFIKELLPDAKIVSFDKDIKVSDITYDSRQVTKDSLFVAIKGEKTDGHKFIPNAIQSGASVIITQKEIKTAPNISQFIVKDSREALAIISDKFYNSPSKNIKLIGITGTNGKTTSAYLIRSILEAAGYKTGQLGTIAYYIGNREIPAALTTPESSEIQEYLSQMVNQSLNYAVIETSSHALVQKRTYKLNFACGVFTNLSRDHLDYHKNITEYRKAKSILFEQLTDKNIAILNQDDPTTKHFESATKAKIIKYSIKNETDFHSHINKNTLEGLELLVKSPIGQIKIQSELIGIHNAYNILTAVTTCVSLGIKDHDAIIKGIADVKAVDGRLENIKTDKPFKIMTDYAHTPDALEQVLASIKPLVKGRLIVVFGCGGDRDKGKRPLMGQAVEKHADIMILTSDNPRTEDPKSIIKDIEKGLSSKKYQVEPDRRLAIEKAISMAKKDDLILIAGKGHETYQIFKDTVKQFDDKLIALEIIQGKPKSSSGGVRMLL